VLLVAYCEQRLLERPSLDAGEELRELVSGGQERFLILRTGRLLLGPMLYQNPGEAPPPDPEKT
jgi:hypothetical protein